MRRNILFTAGIAAVLAGCAQQTYWGFPPGRTEADFRVAETQCRRSRLPLESCLSSRGYYQISEAEYVQRVQTALAALEAAKQPIDFVGFDVETGELYSGVSKSQQPGSGVTSIELSSLDSTRSCTGFSRVTRVVPGGKGSTGWAELLCKDGRKFVGEFVYETTSSGYGRGTDGSTAFLFKFGRMNMDHDKLRAEFREMLKEKKDPTGRDTAF